MSFLQSILLGIIEGFTEFLPISSTAHLVMASSLLGIDQTEFVKTFQIVIQLGAILAIAWVYAKTILEDRSLLPKLIAGFIPTALVGYFLYPFVKDVFLENRSIIGIMLILGGIVLLFFDRLFPEEKATYASINDLPLKKAFTIGCIQAFAIVPGVSRAAATIAGGQYAGLNRMKAVEFSFLLALPTIAAASGYELLSSGLSFSTSELAHLGVGAIVACITALISVKWFLSFITRRSFKLFGWYRIAIGIAFLLMISFL